jgi:hypothetical protein
MYIILQSRPAYDPVAADATKYFECFHSLLSKISFVTVIHIVILSPPLILCSINLVLDRVRVLDGQTLRCEDNVQLELTGGRAAGTLVLAGGRVVLDRLEVDHEVVLDGEDGVGSEPRVVFGVDLGDDGLVVFVGDLFEVRVSSLLGGDGLCDSLVVGLP